MFAFESAAVLYFAALAAAVTFAPATRNSIARAAGASALAAIAVFMAAQTLSPSVRICLPLVYLLLGYWLPAIAASSRPTRLERWLRERDAGWRRAVEPLPRAIQSVLELSYLSCYPALPLAFVVVWRFGGFNDLERFWVAVLSAGFACYGTLPWLVSRPPGRFEANTPRPTAVARLNAFVLRRVSHQLNTLPSGHVAVAAAAAGAGMPVAPAAGAAFACLAAGVAAGAAVGRYHYGLDVLLGAAVGIIAALAAT